MLTQNDLFERADDAIESVQIDCAPEKTPALLAAIAVPCGFRDRHNNPCRRLGNWPIMDEGKQMLCRSRPMVQCDPACFKSDAPVPEYGADDDDIVWEDRIGPYDDE